MDEIIDLIEIAKNEHMDNLITFIKEEHAEFSKKINSIIAELENEKRISKIRRITRKYRIPQTK